MFVVSDILWGVSFFSFLVKKFLSKSVSRIISTLSYKKLLIKFTIVYLAMDHGSISSSSINQEPQPIHMVAKKPSSYKNFIKILVTTNSVTVSYDIICVV